MRAELKREIDRLQEILARHGRDFLPVEPATAEALDAVEQITGMALDPDVRDFLLFSNGSAGEVWGAVQTDRMAPVCFPMLEEALARWELHAADELDESGLWEVSEPPREWDSRLQPGRLRRQCWFPVAEWDGYCTGVYLDAAPGPQGQPGQVVACQCEPDGVFYVADSFLEFLRASNALLEAHGEELLRTELAEIPPVDAAVEEDLRGILARVARQVEHTHQAAPLAEEAVRHGYEDALSFLFGHRDGLRLALEAAVLTGQADEVEDLLSRGVAVDSRDPMGETPLMAAAARGDVAMVRLLLSHGADAAARDVDDETALDKAQRRGHREVVELLAGRLAAA